MKHIYKCVCVCILLKLCDVCDSKSLTVFGFGQEEAALGTFVSDEDGSEEVLAALELDADRAAEVWDLIGEAHDADGGAIRLAFVPAGEENNIRITDTQSGGDDDESQGWKPRPHRMKL